ncbi:MAG: 23S rRNA (guanosine(2251)-2'-O)-methyltransferase RlmB [Candidatus Omnitrophota bacterium]|nr:MAG: 23S rRNA (guanosine(2251)-2'-O)-methyltransferase RlmB [Candidatus Omnitrophota bacterium]
MFLYGKNSVYERLKANPASVRKIFLQDNFDDELIVKKIKSLKIPLEKVNKRRLYRIKRADNLGGVVAQVQPFQYSSFEDLIYKPEPAEKPTFIFLDRIYDPQNLGAIIRIAACFGNFSVVIPKHKACPVTETVLHVACGAENFVPVCLVTNLSAALIEAKRCGWWVAGAVVEGGRDLGGFELPQPLCLVLGSEGKGLRYGVRRHLDLAVSIPMKGAPISLNVTAAAAICCYQISKQSKG